MTYVFAGRLCGFICPDCPEPLTEAQVRLYSTDPDRRVVDEIAASPKETFRLLTAEDAGERQGQLVGEAVTGSDGALEAALDDGYDGGPLRVEVTVRSVAGLPSGSEADPVHLVLTTLQPQWRQREKGLSHFYWDHCISARFWCAVRVRFGVWTICGQVTDCETQRPTAGVTVRAFDADWLQHDELGSAVTDSQGRYRIDYLTSDFRKTPFSPLINIELVEGPDLYFEIETAGTVLLEEAPARGRQADRENSGPCACIDLCVEEPPPIQYAPLFTNVGDFHRVSQIDPATGLTLSGAFGHSGPGWGFFGNPKLKGYCPSEMSGSPMRYRFLFEHAGSPGVEDPITGATVVAAQVGIRPIMWDIDGDGTPEPTFQKIVVAPPGYTPPSLPPTSPPEHVVTPDADGWIPVDPAAWGGGYNGTLLRFRSASLIPGGNATSPGDSAGSPPTDPKDGVTVKIIFEAEPVGGGTPSFREELPKLLINNWSPVELLDLQQFHGPGANRCSPLNADLDVLYTIDHELLRSWDINVSSAGFALSGIPNPSPLESGTTPRGTHGTHHHDISSWPSCSYTVTLNWNRKLTDGEEDDDGGHERLTFCK